MENEAKITDDAKEIIDENPEETEEVKEGKIKEDFLDNPDGQTNIIDETKEKR